MRPVPSGELSSTTSTSSRESCPRICGTRLGTFIDSLYVGTTTSARSATVPAPPPHHRRDHESDDADLEGAPGVAQSPRVVARVKGALDAVRITWQHAA